VKMESKKIIAKNILAKNGRQKLKVKETYLWM